MFREKFLTLFSGGLFFLPLAVVVLAAFLILPNAIKSSSPAWSELDVEPGRFNFSCVSTSGDDVFCMGGMGAGPEGFQSFDHNYAYNTVSGQWQEKAPIPDPALGAMPHLAYLDGKIYLIANPGMYISGGLQYYVYDTAGDTWINPNSSEEFDSYQVGPNRIRSVAVSVYDGNIYLINDYREGEEGDTQRHLRLSKLDLTDGTWTYEVDSKEVSAEETRRDASYTSIGSKIYIFAGHDGLGVWRRSTLVYDIADNSMTAKADIPTYRQDGMVTVGADGKIYIFGGVPVPEELQHGIKTDTVVSYNPSTNSWSSETSLSREDSHGDAVLGSDGEMYVFLSQDSGEPLPPISERPILDYYIDQAHDVSWNMDESAGVYEAYAPSLAVSLCPASFQRCNYHVTPGTENKSFQLDATLSNGKLVATPDEFSMANMAFLAPVGESLERIVLRFAPNVSISGSTDWDGVFHFPSFLSEPSVSPEGEDVEVEKTVKLGGNVGLSLSAPARLAIPGAGESSRVGYVEPDSDEFVEITATCNGDSLEAVTEQLGEGEACKIVVETPEDIAPEYVEPKRLIVWTTHFTEFVTYSEPQEAEETDEGVLPKTGFSGNSFWQSVLEKLNLR